MVDERTLMSGRARRVFLSGIVCSCLLGGCIEESPIVFSPDGRMMAFVTVDPIHTEDAEFVKGRQTSRLMTLDGQRQLRVLEESRDAMLTAPAFSPDGQRLAYLRVPAPTDEQRAGFQKDLEQHSEILKKIANPLWTVLSDGGSPGTQPAAAEIADRALPPVRSVLLSSAVMMLSPDRAAVLIVRDVRTNRVISSTPVEMPVSSLESMYVNTAPRFDPSGRCVYFAADRLVQRVDLATGARSILAAGAEAWRLSPDGRTLATFADDTAGLVASDGDLVVYRRLPTRPIGPPVWLDNQTVAALTRTGTSASQPAATSPASQPAAQESFAIQRVRLGGRLLDPLRIPVSKEVQTGSADGMAISPDNQYIVISINTAALFAAPSGKVFRYLKDDALNLEQPAFSPDSKQVAFKVMRDIGQKKIRAAAIAVFTPEGKELYQVPIPAVPAAASRPQEQ